MGLDRTAQERIVNGLMGSQPGHQRHIKVFIVLLLNNTCQMVFGIRRAHGKGVEYMG